MKTLLRVLQILCAVVIGCEVIYAFFHAKFIPGYCVGAAVIVLLAINVYNEIREHKGGKFTAYEKFVISFTSMLGLGVGMLIIVAR